VKIPGHDPSKEYGTVRDIWVSPIKLFIAVVVVVVATSAPCIPWGIYKNHVVLLIRYGQNGLHQISG
jgi:hypothetical protein